MALMALGTAYFYFAVMEFASVLTFPGAFSDSGLLGARLNTPSWINYFGQLGFLTGVIAYALLKKYPDWARFTALQPRQVMVAWIASAMALVAALVLLTTIGEPLLPKLLLDKTHRNVTVVNFFQMSLGIPAIIAIFCVWRSYRSVLGLWLLLTLFTWVLATVLFVTISERYTLGWYAILLLNLISNLTILTMQLSETGLLYARFIRHTFASEHEHERQLLIREAAAASIAHELRQPIAAIMLNAQVGQMGAPQDASVLFKRLRRPVAVPMTPLKARDPCSRIHRLLCRYPMSMSSFANHSPWFPETSRTTP
jgi:signal transduction histidine kinase